jgi:hypothetical protein
MLAVRKSNGRFACVCEERNKFLFSDVPFARALDFLQRDGWTRAEAIAILVTRPLPREWEVAWRNAQWRKAS